ncbi:SAGA-associated factor 29 isoform X1 [Dermacentor andersoni]|uniref:SAGA-associated factor 29 isoform X1 n=1 Tax=Dermacentor andersoni TaxID=34620 RepID=UPI0021551751|nr:SAGA-associated factor 29-like isoform X1 [Dermacentor andersoni]XP_050026317.1 SAGA-associated factor 29-like isoform X1 [Dermacentor andersoni]XP_050026318.1 SAGA-associated factor 29-like isoform X1 [Dermacentor andersoni]
MQKEADNAVIQEKMRELTHVIQQCQEERNRSEHNLTNITKTHERIQQEQKLSPYYKSKLRGQYKTALQDAESEEELLRKALEIIFEIRTVRNERRIAAKNSGSVGRRSTSFSERPKEALRRGALMKMLQQNALTLPLFIGKEDEKPPPLCGAIPAEPNYVAKVGDMVAALARGPDDDENWILAEVLHYSHGSAKYEVDDIDEEQKERHTLSRRRVVPLPLLRANPLTDPSALFAKGTLVMALYPQTTCFYRALVHEPPSGPQDDYLVLFEDSSYPEGYSPPLAVAQRYVICCKEMRKK